MGWIEGGLEQEFRVDRILCFVYCELLVVGKRFGGIERGGIYRMVGIGWRVRKREMDD